MSDVTAAAAPHLAWLVALWANHRTLVIIVGVLCAVATLSWHGMRRKEAWLPRLQYPYARTGLLLTGISGIWLVIAVDRLPLWLALPLLLGDSYVLAAAFVLLRAKPASAK